MSKWTTIFTRTWELLPSDRVFYDSVTFDVPMDAQRLRINMESGCDQPDGNQAKPDDNQAKPETANSIFQQYTEHPSITPQQRELLSDSFKDTLHKKQIQPPCALLFDPEMNPRGRWDSSFTNGKELGEHGSHFGFMNGRIHPGKWTIVLYANEPNTLVKQIQISIEATPDRQGEREKSNVIQIESPLINEVELAWYVGELHEHTARSAGRLSPEETIKAYKKAGYHFLGLTDHDNPPLNALENPPLLILIRGQEIQWNFGHALLLGIQEGLAPNPEENPHYLKEIIHDVHSKGGLFCAVHPFAVKGDGSKPFWPNDFSDWNQVDLLEIWPGSWQKRFPETLKSFDLWDGLLNQDHRVYGICGKGSGEPAQMEILERSPKTVVLSEGLSETQILSALKQGHFYSTLEPAMSLHVNSEYGGAFMGDELRLPVNSSFVLQTTISQLDRAFIRIKTNKGIYCEMPASSLKETELKFYERASSEIRWFRIEVYRYGRPLDELLAFTNPVFVRGMMSV